MNADDLHRRRLASWGQTPETRVPDPGAAAEFIDRVGVATLFPASPEVPNLFHAHVGDPEAGTESTWDSPSGHVYGWRWELGRAEAAFYTAIVRGRPTWVSWPLLPTVLRLRGELRSPETLYEGGELSADARRIVDALEAAGGVLSTGDLRQAAGFPTGKAQRAAYLRAVQELDSRLLLAKAFSPDADDQDMRHALVRARYPDAITAAERMTPDEALDRLLTTYLPQAVYAVPATLARHLGVPLPALRSGFDRLVARGKAIPIALGAKRDGYAWTEGARGTRRDIRWMRSSEHRRFSMSKGGRWRRRGCARSAPGGRARRWSRL